MRNDTQPVYPRKQTPPTSLNSFKLFSWSLPWKDTSHKQDKMSSHGVKPIKTRSERASHRPLHQGHLSATELHGLQSTGDTRPAAHASTPPDHMTSVRLLHHSPSIGSTPGAAVGTTQRGAVRGSGLWTDRQTLVG